MIVVFLSLLTEPLTYADLKVGVGRTVVAGDIATVHVLAKDDHGKTVADTERRGLAIRFEMVTMPEDDWRSVVEGMKPGGIRQTKVASLVVTVRLLKSVPGAAPKG